MDESLFLTGYKRYFLWKKTHSLWTWDYAVQLQYTRAESLPSLFSPQPRRRVLVRKAREMALVSTLSGHSIRIQGRTTALTNTETLPQPSSVSLSTSLKTDPSTREIRRTTALPHRPALPHVRPRNFPRVSPSSPTPSRSSTARPNARTKVYIPMPIARARPCQGCCTCGNSDTVRARRSLGGDA